MAQQYKFYVLFVQLDRKSRWSAEYWAESFAHAEEQAQQSYDPQYERIEKIETDWYPK